MSRETLLIALGVLIILSPYLGFPYSWLMVLLPVLGLATLGIAITLRLRRRAREEADPNNSNEAQRFV